MSHRHPLRCERNMAGREEALRESDRGAITGIMDDEPVELGEDGEIRRAS